MLQTIEGIAEVNWRDELDAPIVPDWTWSYFVFLTDYSQRTIDNVPRAIKNLVKATVIKPNAGAQTPDPYAEQAIRRFKLDVIQDEDALAGASTDRVRENFRALVRSFELCGGHFVRSA